MTLRLRFQSYSFALQRESISERRVLRILLDDGTATGVGEAAPWGEADFQLCTQALTEAASTLEQYGEKALPQIIAELDSPSARFGLDSARLDRIAKQKGKPLAYVLSPEPSKTISVNAMIPLLPPNTAAEAAAKYRLDGYRVLKLKLGRPSFSEDMATVKKVRQAAPDLKLRLDANACWTLEQAATALAQLSQFGVEYIEQPCRDWRDIAALARSTPIPIALDESLTDFESVRLIAEAPTNAEARTINRWVLKPSRFGSLAELRQAIETARANGISVTLTHFYDGPIGFGVLQHAAAAWLPEETHGLAPHYASFAAPKVHLGRLCLPFDEAQGSGLLHSRAAAPQQTVKPRDTFVEPT